MTDNTAGVLWALAGAILASFTGVLAMWPLRRMGVLAATLLTNFVNMVLLAGVGWWSYREGQASLVGLLWFALLGVTAYSCGRFVYFKALATIGPPRLMTIASTAPLLSLLLAVVFLGERPSGVLLAGTVFVISGVILVSYEPSEGAWFQRGIIWGFASAFSLGVSVFIRKKGLAAMPNLALTVAWANFVSLVIVPSLRPLVSRALFSWGSGGAVVSMLLVAVLNSVNQLLYNLAVIRSDISVVAPILSSSPIFSLFFTALLLRDTARVRPVMVLGVFLTVAGMVVIALKRG